MKGSTTPAQLVRLARPHQWLKNAFVFVGILFAHRWNEPEVAAAVLEVFAAFCLMSSAVYALNDVRDRDADRRHPVKRNRPVASGCVSVRAAAAFSLVLAVAGLALASLAGPVAVALVAGYALLNLVYSLGAKHVVILDVFMIAAGFMLRILAGTLGVGIAPSQWLLLCGLLITLFLGFAKRRAELIALEEGSGGHRPALEQYNPAVLDHMISVAAAGVVVTYSLYTVDASTVALHQTDKLVYTVPFVLYGLFRYVFLLHRRGGGGDPAWDLMHDRHLAFAGAGWLAVTLFLFARGATL